jgi:hypothetical protein
MKVRIADLSGQPQTIDVPASISILNLKEIIQERNLFDSSSCRVFSAGTELKETDLVPSDGTTIPLLVFYNDKLFPEKSYPSVDNAFPFPESRFGRVGGARPPNQRNFPFHRSRFHPFPLERLRRFELEGGFEFTRGLAESGPLRDLSDGIRLLSGLVHPDPEPESDSGDVDLPPPDPADDQPNPESDGSDEDGIPAAADMDLALDFQFVRDHPDFDLAFDSDSDESNPRTNIAIAGVQVDLTPEQQAAVVRFRGLGFEDDIIVQVFEACGRDENVTHQCLLSMH